MSKQALPKAQRTQGLSSLTKVTAFKQHKNSTSNIFKTSAFVSKNNFFEVTLSSYLIRSFPIFFLFFATFECLEKVTNLQKQHLTNFC